jgi:hypothetical protein
MILEKNAAAAFDLPRSWLMEALILCVPVLPAPVFQLQAEKPKTGRPKYKMEAGLL